MAWYGKFVEPAISKREATRYRAIVNRIWQISVPKEFERLYSPTEKQSTRRCTEKPDASVLLSRKSFATWQGFLQHSWRVLSGVRKLARAFPEPEQLHTNKGGSKLPHSKEHSGMLCEISVRSVVVRNNRKLQKRPYIFQQLTGVKTVDFLFLLTTRVSVMKQGGLPLQREPRTLQGGSNKTQAGRHPQERSPIRRRLDAVELGVQAAFRHEVVVGADLGDASAVEHDDEIGHAHGGETM